MRSLRRSPAKHIDLLPQDQVFRFQRCSRLEAQSHDTENQLEQIGHQDASLRRPLAASTPNRIFGTHRPKARELILGVADDPTFGTVIVFGRGGTAVEIINDKALALPPLDLQLARDLIERTRVSRLLRAYRDVPAVKPDSVAMVLVKLAQMAADIPEIRELDINPLLADETGVLAVDARVAVGRVERKFGGSGPANFAVRPYPSQWQRHLEMKDGWRVFVRPIRPEDEPLIHEFLRHVTSQDLRLRFFAPIKEFTHEFIARLTQLDYARAMAFVAFDEATKEMIGMVRIHSEFDL